LDLGDHVGDRRRVVYLLSCELRGDGADERARPAQHAANTFAHRGGCSRMKAFEICSLCCSAGSASSIRTHRPDPDGAGLNRFLRRNGSAPPDPTSIRLIPNDQVSAMYRVLPRDEALGD